MADGANIPDRSIGNGNNGLDGFPSVNPADHGGDGGGGTDSADSGGEQRRRRGRPPGSRNKRTDAGGGTGERVKRSPGARTSAKATLDIDGVSALLVLIHRGIQDRARTVDVDGVEVWPITSSEGDALAKAASNVLRHYDLVASQKAMDIGAAITVAFAVYMPRIGRAVEARNQPPQPGPRIVA